MFWVVLSGRLTRLRVVIGGPFSNACLTLVLSETPMAGRFWGALLKKALCAIISALKFPPDPGMRPVHPRVPFCIGNILYPEGIVGSFLRAEPSPVPIYTGPWLMGGVCECQSLA